MSCLIVTGLLSEIEVPGVYKEVAVLDATLAVAIAATRSRRRHVTSSALPSITQALIRWIRDSVRSSLPLLLLAGESLGCRWGVREYWLCLASG